MRNNIIILLFITILYSCSESQKAEIDITQISIDIKKPEPLKLSTFFDDIKYVSLSDSVMIGDIERIKLYGNHIFLLTNKSILVHDIKTGDLLLRIRNIGNGPGEYVSLYDMLFDEDNNIIEVLDMNGKKIMKYGFDGTFIEEIEIPFFSFAFHKIDHLTYFFYNSNIISDVSSHKLIKYNIITSKIIDQHLPINKHMAEYFYTVDSDNFGSIQCPSFHFCPSDIVYGFTENYSIFPKYHLYFGSNHTPNQFYNGQYTDIADFSTKATRLSYIYSMGNFHENNHIAALSFRNNQDHYWALFDKKNQRTYVGNRLLDDYNCNTSTTIEYTNGPFAIDDKQMYYFLQPAQLIDLMKDPKNKEHSHKNESINQIYNSDKFSEQSNPILVICKFKEL